MGLIGFLIGFPLIVAIIMLFIKSDGPRDIIVIAGVAVVAVASILLAALHLTDGTLQYSFYSVAVTAITILIDVAICVYIVYMCVRYKRFWIGCLAVLQTVIALVYELVGARNVEIYSSLYTDSLSIIMALIIGIIGGGICIYAIGYMKDHVEHHPEQKDNRNIFFAILFLFLGAMYGVVFCDNLAWFFTAWEITTVSSFMLIGYTKTEEAINNSFRQIWMNMIGGLALIVGIAICGLNYGISQLSVLVQYASYTGYAMLPVMLFAFAALTKAAQMPFHSWLLGAMVAPTPVSALLHSSTMVKAAVFLLIKLSPCFGMGSWAGLAVMMVGGITFLSCSCMAITQSNAKRVLAYSTIANLGLIIVCAGLGTPEAVWAAIFLLIFHAAAKSLLFLCVGSAEHHIGSRDIEDMDDLFIRMPRLARFMAIGMFVMFIAPFGMLIAKWAAMVSVIDSGNFVLLLILVFGSAATFMFWAKWLGKITAIGAQKDNVEKTVFNSEWFAIIVMAVLALGASVFFPLISSGVVVPYLSDMFGQAYPGVDDDSLWIMAIIAMALIVVFIGFFGRSSKKRKVPVYLAGVGTDFENRNYINSLSGESEATSRNWYLDKYFGEKKLTVPSNLICIAIIVIGIAICTILWGVGY